MKNVFHACEDAEIVDKWKTSIERGRNVDKSRDKPAEIVGIDHALVGQRILSMQPPAR
jgi:hypothetical protein